MSTAVPDAAESKSLFGYIVAFSIHSAVVYGCAIRLSPWLVYHWFGWIAPLLHVSINVPAGDWPAGDWYLQHLELVTIVPALIIGYINVTRFVPVSAKVARSGSVATWAWTIPAIVISCKILLYHHAQSSVLYSSSTTAIEYVFDILRRMPTRTNPFASDAIRVLAQMMVTAPFYAGLAYSLGALASKHEVARMLFSFAKHEPVSPPES